MLIPYITDADEDQVKNDESWFYKVIKQSGNSNHGNDIFCGSFFFFLNAIYGLLWDALWASKPLQIDPHLRRVWARTVHGSSKWQLYI